MDVTWIKLDTGLFGDTKIKYLRQQKSGDSIALFWVGLLTLAGECNDKGMIYVTPKVPYTYQGLADSLGFPLPVIKKAIPLFVSLDMLEENDGFLWIVNWNEHQNVDGLEKVREQNRIRKQSQRQREKEADSQRDENEAKSTMSRDTSRECHKDKVPQKEENKEEEKDKETDIYTGGGQCANECVGGSANQYPSQVVQSLFFKFFKREPYEKEVDYIAESFGLSHSERVTDDQKFLLEKAFDAAVMANALKVSYISACLRNMVSREITTREKYEAWETDRKKAGAKESTNPSYGDSDIFWEAAMVAGLKDW